MEQFRVEEFNANALAIGQHDCKARCYVQQYAISDNFAVKNGWVKHKDHLFAKCSAVVGTRGDNIPKHSSHCPWRVRFKKQLDDQWVITELIDEHQGHPLEGINPYAYAENGSLNEAAKQVVLALVRDSSATHTKIADMVNVTYGTHILARDLSREDSS
ncbi:hypothetical protein V1506DRAFT_566692 [Lipomyces tetrasporus]